MDFAELSKLNSIPPRGSQTLVFTGFPESLKYIFPVGLRPYMRAVSGKAKIFFKYIRRKQ